MTSLTNIAVLGATGSIGRSALEVISRYQERYRVFALTAGSNVEKLAQLASVWRPYIVAIADESRYKALVEEMRKLGITGVSVAAGADAISDIAAMQDVDVVVQAVVGAAGVAPSVSIRRSFCLLTVNTMR